MGQARPTYKTNLEQWKRELSAELGRDVTYEDIAQDTNVSYSTLMKHARFKFRRPDYATAAAICDFFNKRSSTRRTPLEYFEEASEGQGAGLAAQAGKS